MTFEKHFKQLYNLRTGPWSALLGSLRRCRSK